MRKELAPFSSDALLKEYIDRLTRQVSDIAILLRDTRNQKEQLDALRAKRQEIQLQLALVISAERNLEASVFKTTEVKDLEKTTNLSSSINYCSSYGTCSCVC